MKYPQVRVGKSYAGKGLFALEDIKKGRNIIQYIGPKVTNKEAEAKMTRYIFEVDSKYSLDGSPMYNIARWANHSCKPSGITSMDSRKRIFIEARRNIKSGEEITVDYGRDYFDTFIRKGGCKCLECKKVS